MRVFAFFMLSIPAWAQDVVTFSDLATVIHPTNDTTYVVNFWATWCGPCVEELPHFEKLRSTYSDKKLRVVLVSLDFKSQIDSRVRPFIEKRGLRSTVWLLDETDANAYIERVDSSWSGAIPATLIVNKHRSRRSFYEKQMHFDELVAIVEPLIQ